MRISRRTVLGGIGQTAALGALASALSPQLRAAQAAASEPAAPAAAAASAATYCLSTVYGAKGADANFNADAFHDTQMPLMQKAYGKSANRIELRMPAPRPGADPSEIIATVNIWFTDVNDFAKHNSAAAKELAAGMAYITKAPASGQVDQVIAEMGDARLTVPVDGLCLSTYFPDREGATIDTKYFAEVFYPKLAEMYGTAVVRRIEVTSGAAGAGRGKPAMVNSAHVYIRDDAAFFEEAAIKAGLEMAAEAPNHTNIKPLQTLTRVHAAV